MIARKRLDKFESVFQTAQLTVVRTLRGKRIFGMLAVAILPAALAFLVRSKTRPGDQEEFFYGMLSVFHFGLAVPVVALTFATQFPWPEAEEGTLTYWFTSPVPRWTVHLGRWLAALVVGWLILPVSVLAIGLPLATDPEAELGSVMRGSIGATLLAYPAYLALFWLVATVFRRGLVFGVIFVIVENFLSFIHGTIVHLTLVYYVRSEVSYAVPQRARRIYDDVMLFENVPATAATAITTFICVTLTCLALSLVAVESIEYRGRTSQPG